MNRLKVIQGIYSELDIEPYYNINYENLKDCEEFIKHIYSDIILKERNIFYKNYNCYCNKLYKPFNELLSLLINLQYTEKDFLYEETYIRQIAYKLWEIFGNPDSKLNWFVSIQILEACCII